MAETFLSKSANLLFSLDLEDQAKELGKNPSQCLKQDSSSREDKILGGTRIELKHLSMECMKEKGTGSSKS